MLIHRSGITMVTHAKKKKECGAQTSHSEAKRREERVTLTDDACAGIFFIQKLCRNIVH